MLKHFALEYARRVNGMLHYCMMPTWFYKHEIYEVSGLVTALLITYDDQHDDEFIVQSGGSWQDFLNRMSRLDPKWAGFSRENMEGLAQQPQKTMLGWENRTFYYVKGGSNPEYWTTEHADEDTTILISQSALVQGPMMQAEVEHVHKSIPAGKKHSRRYEDFVRRVINYLFVGHLGECKAQDRTEPGNEGCEIRDLLCQNQAEIGIWKDIKDKYQCSEVLFEAKNEKQLRRDDLRQTYCYLKPALGLWGFVVCRAEQPDKVHAYNRTLFKNFAQTRGVLILTDGDLKQMVKLKLYGQDPSDYLRDRMSEFIRSI